MVLWMLACGGVESGLGERPVEGALRGIETPAAVKLIASDAFSGVYFGSLTAGAGDVNGDGYADLLVSAPYGADSTGAFTGTAYLYYGSASGIDASTEQRINASDTIAHHNFGLSGAAAGDVNGDGYDDVIIGAIGDSDGGSESGAVYVLYGAASGISGEDKLTASDAESGDRYGYGAAGAGDVNGDGYDDVIVGANCNGDAGSCSGSTYLYYGSPSGLDHASEVKITASDAEAGDHFGFQTRGAGDLNGDGYDDVMVSANGETGTSGLSGSGSLYVYYGSSAGLDVLTEQKLRASDEAEFALFGLAHSSGDFNGDGYLDIVAGACGSGDYVGSIYTFHGSPAGIDAASEQRILPASPESSMQFGCVVSGAGDIDGDGFGDAIIGAPGCNALTGCAHVYYGSPAGLAAASEEQIVAFDAEYLDFFAMAAGAGDVNGDGFDDVAVGAPEDIHDGLYSGSVYVYLSAGADGGPGTGGEDTGGDPGSKGGDTGSEPIGGEDEQDTGSSTDEVSGEEGARCATSSGSASAVLGLVGLLLLRRRRG